jgi:hypothetical protein
MMFMQAKPWVLAIAAMLAHSAVWAEGHGINVNDMKFATMPILPSCASAAVPQGDPTKGPSFVYGKIGSNCVIPWHWHTANENIMMVSGEAKLETRDGKPITITTGGFAMMPSKHVHRFTCVKSCSMYVYSDAIFDIHYVNAQGQEIAADEALKKKP